MYRKETVTKTIPKKKKCKKAKWLSEEALQIPVKRREAKSKGEKERYTHLNSEFQRIARRDEKAFLSDQCKETGENNRMEKTRDLFKKIRDTKGIFHAKMGTIKDRNSMDLTEAEDIKMWQEYTKELYKKGLNDSDDKLFIDNFRLKLKKVGKTTRPFRYDLNQIPHDYTVKVRNRPKGLDLRDKGPEELWMEVCDIVQEMGIKMIPKKKKCKKAKWLSEEALQIPVKRREAKSKGEKEVYTRLNAEFQRIARRDKKAIFSDQCKEREGKKQTGKD